MAKRRAERRERVRLGSVQVATGFEPGKVTMDKDTILAAVPRLVCVGVVEALVGEVVGASPRGCCGARMSIVQPRDGSGAVAACWHAMLAIPNGVDPPRVTSGGRA